MADTEGLLKLGFAMDADTSGAMIDLLGKIHLGINDNVREARTANQREQQRLKQNPNYITIVKNTTTANAFDVIDFGGPQPGRQWQLRILGAYSAPAPPAANATAVTWYVGPPIPIAGTNGILPLNAPWGFPSLPNWQKFNGEITVLPNQHILAGLTGIPASSNLNIEISVYEEPYDPAQYVVTSV